MRDAGRFFGIDLLESTDGRFSAPSADRRPWAISAALLVNVLTAFAATALLLAAIGIYGVIAHSVTRRTPEIGIRMALGASRSSIRAGVVTDTLRLTLLGAAIGVIGAIALSSLLSSLLFGVSPNDPWTSASTAALLLLVAVAAGFIPAFRASRISPMTALCTE